MKIKVQAHVSLHIWHLLPTKEILTAQQIAQIPSNSGFTQGRIFAFLCFNVVVLWGGIDPVTAVKNQADAFIAKLKADAQNDLNAVKTDLATAQNKIKQLEQQIEDLIKGDAEQVQKDVQDVKEKV